MNSEKFNPYKDLTEDHLELNILWTIKDLSVVYIQWLLNVLNFTKLVPQCSSVFVGVLILNLLMC